jgi:hypothetical protein
MAHSAKQKEQGPNGDMHSVKSGSDKEDRTENIFASREFNSVSILVRLAVKESYSQNNCQK